MSAQKNFSSDSNNQTMRALTVKQLKDVRYAYPICQPCERIHVSVCLSIRSCSIRPAGPHLMQATDNVADEQYMCDGYPVHNVRHSRHVSPSPVTARPPVPA